MQAPLTLDHARCYLSAQPCDKLPTPRARTREPGTRSPRSAIAQAVASSRPDRAGLRRRYGRGSVASATIPSRGPRPGRLGGRGRLGGAEARSGSGEPAALIPEAASAQPPGSGAGSGGGETLLHSRPRLQFAPGASREASVWRHDWAPGRRRLRHRIRPRRSRESGTRPKPAGQPPGRGGRRRAGQAVGDRSAASRGSPCRSAQGDRGEGGCHSPSSGRRGQHGAGRRGPGAGSARTARGGETRGRARPLDRHGARGRPATGDRGRGAVLDERRERPVGGTGAASGGTG